MRYLVTPLSAACCIVGLLLGVIGFIALVHSAYLPAVLLLVLAFVAIKAADRISKDALGDW